MMFVDWNGPYDDVGQPVAQPRFGDERTGWCPGEGRSLEDVAAAVRDVDPHAGDLIDTSDLSSPIPEDGPQPWEGAL